MQRFARLLTALALVLGSLGAGARAPASADANVYRQSNLVSDIPGVARITDPNLSNPWGLAASESPASPIWSANNNTGTATVYVGGVNGSAASIVPLVVGVPRGLATGQVFNGTRGFVVSSGGASGPATFIFSSLRGTITAWSSSAPSANAVTKASVPGAVYTGLALAGNSMGNFLYAANFATGGIDVFDSSFHRARLPGSFRDPNLPAGYAPFNIKNLRDKLYVAYAKVAPDGDEEKGPGNGFVDVYDTNGHLVRRLASRGTLNAPWGFALAPAGFGGFGGDVLVGNFGDGTINAFDPVTGAFHGQLRNPDGNVIAIDGLWGLRIGNGVFGSKNSLVFAAGIGDEEHGLLGVIDPGR